MPGVRRVLTFPGLGAFAMMISTRPVPDLSTGVSLEVFIDLTEDLYRPWTPGLSVPEIITHYQAENEPGGAKCSSHCAADLRLSNAGVVTHRNFDYSVSAEGAF